MEEDSNDVTVISRDAILASTLMGVMSYVENDDKLLWGSLTNMRIHILMPDNTDTGEELATIFFLFTVAHNTDNVEVMADIFDMCKHRVDVTDILKRIAEMDIIGSDESNDIREIKMNGIFRLAKLAGLRNIREAFNELDLVALEMGVPDMSENALKEALQ